MYKRNYMCNRKKSTCKNHDLPFEIHKTKREKYKTTVETWNKSVNYCKLKTLFTLSSTRNWFFRYNFSLYISTTSTHLLNSLFTLGEAPSGGHEQNRKSRAITGLSNVSANLRSLRQLSLWIYLGVIKHKTSEADFMLRSIRLCRLLVESGNAGVAADLVLRLLWPLMCAPLSTQHRKPWVSNIFVTSAT